MNPTVTISRRHLRDTESDPLHLLLEDGLVLVPAAGGPLLLRGHLVVPTNVPVLLQEELAGNTHGCRN